MTDRGQTRRTAAEAVATSPPARRTDDDHYLSSRSMDMGDVGDHGEADHNNIAMASAASGTAPPAGGNDGSGPAHAVFASGSIAMQVEFQQQQQKMESPGVGKPNHVHAVAASGAPIDGGTIMRRRISDDGNENSPTDNSRIAGPTEAADPREPSAARTPIKSSVPAPAPAVAASNEPTRQGMSLDDDDDEHDSAANSNSDRYDTGNFFARSAAAATDDSDGRGSDVEPALVHRLDTSVRQQSELRRRKLVVPRKSSSMFSPNDNNNSSSSATAPSSNGASGKVRKRGNLRVLAKSTSESSGGGGGSSLATSTSSAAATSSSAFFTRSVRSVVDTAASVQSTARSAAAPVAGMSKKIVNAGKVGISILSPTFAVQSRAAATPLPLEESPGLSLTPRKIVNGGIDVDGDLATPRQANRKNGGDSDQAALSTPLASVTSTETASFLFSSPERLRPIGRVASAATMGLRQRINSVSQSPAVTKAVLFSKERSSEIMTKRRAKRAAAIKSRLARIERLKAEGKYSPIIIPADHPMKIAWDVLTIILTILSALRTHQSIRDRTYDQSPFVVFTEFWFILDIVLNFFCEHKTSSGEIIRDGRSVWARYLTTWFIIDALSVVSWERIYVKPIVDKQKRRNFFTKTFFRSKAVVRVTRILRGRHVKLFGRVAKQTKTVGVGGQRLLRLIIKYLPKYLLFYRNMRSVLVVRTLRQVHFLRKLWKSFVVSIRREPLVVLRRPGMVFAAASADWTEEDDWAFDDLDDEDDDEEDDDDANGLEDNSLLDRRGSKDSLNEADETDGVSRQLHVEDDAGKVTLERLSVLLPDLDDMSDDPHSASTGTSRSNQLHQKRIRSMSEGGDAFGSSITPSSSSGSLRMRRTNSQLGLNGNEEKNFFRSDKCV